VAEAVAIVEGPVATVAAGHLLVVAVAHRLEVVQRAAAMEEVAPRAKANLLQRSEHNSKQSDQQGSSPC